VVTGIARRQTINWLKLNVITIKEKYFAEASKILDANFYAGLIDLNCNASKNHCS
jgi:hypothetical protein